MTIKTPREVLESFSEKLMRAVSMSEAIRYKMQTIDLVLATLDEYYASRVSVEEIDKIIGTYLIKWAKEDGFTSSIGTLRRKDLAQAIHNFINLAKSFSEESSIQITQILIDALIKERTNLAMDEPTSVLKSCKQEATRISREIGEELKGRILQRYTTYKPFYEGTSYCKGHEKAYSEINKIIEEMFGEEEEKPVSKT